MGPTCVNYWDRNSISFMTSYIFYLEQLNVINYQIYNIFNHFMLKIVFLYEYVVIYVVYAIS